MTGTKDNEKRYHLRITITMIKTFIIRVRITAATTIGNDDDDDSDDNKNYIISENKPKDYKINIYDMHNIKIIQNQVMAAMTTIIKMKSVIVRAVMMI